MNRPLRIVAVTVGLVGAGAVFGALAGAFALALGLALTDGPMVAAEPWVVSIGAYFGAPIGAVSLPIVAWVWLRRVALGRAIGGSVVGTVVGGVLGWIVPSDPAPVIEPLVSAFLGFVTAAVVMWFRTSPRGSALVPE